MSHEQLAEHLKLLLESDMPGKTFKESSGRRVREFARLHLVETAPIYPAFGYELSRRDLLQ